MSRFGLSPRRQLVVAIGLAAIAAGCAGQQARRPAAPPAVTLADVPHAPDSGTLAIRCGTLIDGVSDAARSAITVLIQDGRITAVGDDVSRPPGVPVLDLSDYTCLPGLIDMHSHIMEGPEDLEDLTRVYQRTPAEQVALGREYAATTLAAGFTSARCPGTYIGWTSRTLRDEINQGLTVGPRLQVAGYYLTVPGGGGDMVVPGIPEADVPARVRMGVARGPAAFRQKAELAVAGGADFLKVIASGAVLAYGGVPGEPEMTPEEIAAVVEVAHAAGLRVAAHAHGARSIKESILAGADTIEHASIIDDEGIALARDHRVALVMDVYNGDYAAEVGRLYGWPEEFMRKMAETTDVQREGFRKAVAAGAPIVFGSDGGVYPHGINAIQFPIMVEHGMTAMHAIKAATSLAAEYMDWSDRVGGVIPGRYGDLIAVRGDPLANIAVLQDAVVVIKGGLAFKLPEG